LEDDWVPIQEAHAGSFLLELMTFKPTIANIMNNMARKAPPVSITGIIIIKDSMPTTMMTNLLFDSAKRATYSLMPIAERYLDLSE